MGRRYDIDWEAIERDYRVSQLSVREVGAKHKVSPSAIVRRAEKFGWTRNLAAAVVARTQAKLLEAKAPDKSNADPAQSAQQAALLDAQTVEVAAAVNVAVILSHRGTIAKARAITDELFKELETGAKESARARKKAPLEKRAAIVKSLSEASRVQIGLERQAFNIVDGSQDPADPLNSLIADLVKRGSVLPISEDTQA